MKPAYWIAILAVIGGLLGYTLSRASDWLGTVGGIVLGILVGTLLYAWQTRTLNK